MESIAWKYPLIKQQKAQVIRILRPEEMTALIDHVSIDDEPNWTKSRETPTLKESGLTTEDREQGQKGEGEKIIRQIGLTM